MYKFTKDFCFKQMLLIKESWKQNNKDPAQFPLLEYSALPSLEYITF